MLAALAVEAALGNSFVAERSAEASRAHCRRSGWAFPWGLRVQLAEVLLQGLFDSEARGYVPQHERLLAGIARQLWPLLGISAPVADALWAWVHFREVCGVFMPGASFFLVVLMLGSRALG